MLRNKLIQTIIYADLALIGLGATAVALTNQELKKYQQNTDSLSEKTVNIENELIAQNNFENKKTPSLEDILQENKVNMHYVLRDIETKQIPVLMFHNIDYRENRYTISPNNFRVLLEKLHENNFYSVTLQEYINADFAHIPIGKKPILFTFDDSTLGQFKIDDIGNICRNSAVGILNEFYENNDFGKGAVFYVSLGSQNNFQLPFYQDAHVTEKLRYLVDSPFEIGYHTHNHANNTQATKNNIKEQEIMLKAIFHHYLGDEYFNKMTQNQPNSFAHPFGATPQNDTVYQDLINRYDVVFRAWGGFSNHPLSRKFNEKEIPRRETTLQNIDYVINSINTYKITEDSKKYYSIKKSYEQNRFPNNDLLTLMPSITNTRIYEETDEFTIQNELKNKDSRIVIEDKLRGIRITN
ncbi:MAG: hypothetical protein ACLFN8_04205 [Candidatus Woesearchaeota archaeon]